MEITDFIKNIPTKIDQNALAGINTVFHFDMGDTDESKYTVKVDDGKVSVENGLHGESKCTVKASKETLTKLINKELNPMTAMMMGKIKISNIGELMKYAKTFGII